MRCDGRLRRCRGTHLIARALVGSIYAAAFLVLVPVWAEAEDELNGLRIEVELAQSGVLVGEPLIVSLRLTNTADDTLALSSAIDKAPREMPVSFVFLGPGGEQAAWKHPVEVDMLPPRGILPLAPGDYVITRFNLAVSANPVGKRGGPPVLEWNFRGPGSYAVVGRYRVPSSWGPPFWQGTIESEPVTFEVQEPAGTDRLAFEILDNKEVRYQYLWLPVSPVLIRQSLRKVISDYPTSRYAVYAEYYLGILLLTHEKSIDHLRTFIANHPTFPLVPDAEFWIADLLYRLERFDDARAQLAMASARYPHDAHVTDRLAKSIKDPEQDLEQSEVMKRVRAFEELHGTKLYGEE